MGLEIGGFFGLIILILDVWAILKVFQSDSSNGAKVFWTVFILVLPILGLLIWLLAGPKQK